MAEIKNGSFIFPTVLKIFYFLRIIASSSGFDP
jgi:hypothetical protein